MTINRLYKRTHWIAGLVLCVVIINGCGAVLGQQADSLSFYLEQAALNNPGLKARFSEYRAALERVPQAGALPDPEMQLGFFIKPMQLLGGNQVADIRLMQMSPWFGTLSSAKDEASKMAVAKYEAALSERNNLYFLVKSSWYQVFLTGQEINVAERNLVLLHSLERMALIRYKSEDKPGGMVNLLRVQMEIGSLENRIASLRDQLTTDKARFNSHLNRKPEMKVFISDSLMEAPLPGSFLILEDSVENNPMIRMYEAERSAYESRIGMVRKMSYPMVGIGLNYSLIQKRTDAGSAMNGKDMLMPMVTATLPIYRKKYSAMKHEAESRRDASAEFAVNVRNELTVQYREAVQQYRDADRRTALYSRQASLAEKSVTLLTSSFSAAGTDFEEILRMQQQLLDYEIKRIQAVVDRNVAVARLNSLLSMN